MSKTPSQGESIEPSPSTGAKETAAAMHAVYAFGDRDGVATLAEIHEYAGVGHP